MSIASVRTSFITSSNQRMIGNLDVAFDVFRSRRPRRGRPTQEDRRCECAESAAELSCRPGSAAAPASGWRPSASASRRWAKPARPAPEFPEPFRVAGNERRRSSGKLCCSASAMFRPSSVAAACNSKLNDRQKRLRSASPQALLMRPPKGAWMINCMPPPSSKKRSAMMVCCVGTSPSTARPVTMYSTSLLGAGVVEPAFVFQPGDGVLHLGAGFDAAQADCGFAAGSRLKPSALRRGHA